MPLRPDIGRIPVVGAEEEERRSRDRQQRQKPVEIPPGRPFAEHDRHSPAELLLRLRARVGFVAVADSGRQVSIQRPAGEQRRVTVDVPVLEERELFQDAGVSAKHARHIHHLGQPGHAGTPAVRRKVRGGKLRSGRFKRRRRHAARQLEEKIHGHLRRAVEKVVERPRSGHIRQLVRIAERRRHAARQNHAFEFERRHQRRLDVNVAVDISRHRDEAVRVENVRSVIPLADTDDRIARDCNVARQQRTGRQVEHRRVPDHEIGGLLPFRLPDAPCQNPFKLRQCVTSPKIRSRRNSADKNRAPGQAPGCAGTRPSF